MAARTTSSAGATPTQEQTLSEIAYLTRALKAPTLRDSVQRLAERARSEGWTHEQFLAACLQRKVSAATRTAVKAGSAPRGSRPAKPWSYPGLFEVRP